MLDCVLDILYKRTVETQDKNICFQKTACPFLRWAIRVGTEFIWPIVELSLDFVADLALFSLPLISNVLMVGLELVRF